MNVAGGALAGHADNSQKRPECVARRTRFRSSRSSSIDRVSRDGCRARWISPAPGRAPALWSRGWPERAASGCRARGCRASIKGRLAASSKKRSPGLSDRPDQYRPCARSGVQQAAVAHSRRRCASVAHRGDCPRLGRSRSRDAGDRARMRGEFRHPFAGAGDSRGVLGTANHQILERRPADGQCRLERADRSADAPDRFRPLRRGPGGCRRSRGRLTGLRRWNRTSASAAFFNRRLKADQFLRRRELELEAYAARAGAAEMGR